MRFIALGLCLAVGTIIGARADTAYYPTFADTSKLTFHGSAAATTTGDGPIVRVVPDIGGQSGGVYRTAPVLLGKSGAFTTQFQFRVTTTTSQPADGLTFVLAKSPDQIGIGWGGGNLAYHGVANSVAVEFDTFYDYGGNAPYDAAPNQVAIDEDGDVSTAFHPRASWGQPYGQGNCYTAPTAAGCLSDGNLWTVTISYDGKQMSVAVQDGSAAPYQVITNYAIDLAKHIGGDVAYVGFTAATGGGYANFDIVNWRFDSPIYSFSGSAATASRDGMAPASQLTPDKSGNLYGTAAAGGPSLCKASPTSSATCGALFMLTPPATQAGSWSEKPVYWFSQRAWSPQGRLLVDSATSQIFGTTLYGGNGCVPTGCGTVYSLALPTASSGARVSLLRTFANPAGGLYPNGRLVMASSGALYGSTILGGKSNQGLVFELTPPAAGADIWGYKVLYDFTGAAGASPGNITTDSNGVIYGATMSGGAWGFGTAYRLSPPPGSGKWTFAKLHDFQGSGHSDGAAPGGGLVVAKDGTLYGTTARGGNGGCSDAGCGTVFALTPSANGAAPWPETVLYAFQGGSDGSDPVASLIASADLSTLFGTTMKGGAGCGTAGCGTVFALSPPAGGSGPWTETQLYGFAGTPDGAAPAAGLHMDATGALFGTTMGGGLSGSGTVFRVTP